MKKSLRAGTKLLALLASAFLLFNVTACSSDDSDEDSPVSPSSEPSVVKDSGVITITAPEAAGAVTLVADSASAIKLYEGTSVQKALEVLMNDTYKDSTDSFTISVARGTYEEMLFYTGSATINIVGTGTAQYGTDVLITYSNSGNSNAMQELANSHGVTGGYFRGSNRFDGKVNLVLKNITLQNSYSRGSDTSNTQAEALVFSSTGNLIAYNSSFLSHQDTLYLGQKGGRMWFYKDYISGDVDFIWGYMDVALFEECSIYCRGDEATKAYIFASRSMTDAEANKGIVLLHNNIEVATGVTMWYGRNSGSDTQAAILNNTITGAGTLNSNLYQSAPLSYVTDVAGDLAIGYKDCNNTFNGTVVDTSNRLDLCGALSERVAKREYNGRYVILNRGYSETNEKYATSSTKWDISKYEEEFGATEDTSNTNIYVDPVYAKNIVGGGKVQLTPSSDEANLTYSYKSSDESLAKVDANGLVTTVAGADGTAVITVTASNGSTDTMSVKVIPVEIPATAVKVALADTSVAKYGVTTATVTFEPADTSNQEFTLVSDNESVQLFDTSTQKLASSTTVEAVDGKATVSVWVGGNVTDATLTAKSTVYNSATAGTAKVSTTEGAVTWGDTGAWRVATDIQSGKYGIYDGLVIDSEADDNDLISTDGKMSLKTNSKMQTRNVTLYIPVEGASTVTINMASSFESTDSLYFSVGSASSSSFTASDDNLTYTYTYDGGATGIVFGSDVTTAVTGILQKQAGEGISASGKYLKVNVVGGDRYIKTIDVVKTGDFDADAFAVAATAVSVSPSTANVTVGDTTTLAAALTPSDSTDSVTWSSSDESVATVDADGVVTGVKAGTATITATAGSVTGTATITVSNATVAATAISLDASTATVEVKDTVTLVATVTPSDSTDSVTWTSSDESVATVASGVVTGVKAGKATITAKAGDCSAECEVTVVAYASGSYEFGSSTYITDSSTGAYSSSDSAVTGTGLTADGKGHGYAVAADSTVTIHVAGITQIDVLGCAYGNGAAFTAKVGDTTLATVSSCKASTDGGVGATFYYTTAKAADIVITFTGAGWVHGIKVTPLDSFTPVSSITVTAADNATSVYVGGALQLTATTNSDATNQSVTWSSGTPATATVSSDGVVTGVADGSVTITATANDGSGVTGTYTVTVSTNTAEETGPWTWDWKNGTGDAKNVNIQKTSGTVYAYDTSTSVLSTKVSASVDATNNGKLAYNTSGYAQINANTTITIAMTAGQTLAIETYPTNYALTVAGTAYTYADNGTSISYTATADGDVVIAATSTGYLYSITLSDAE